MLGFFHACGPHLALHSFPTRRSSDLTMVGHGQHVRCKVSAPDGFAAVDLAVQKLEHQLHKLKTKLVRRNHAMARRGNGAAAAPTTGLSSVDEDEEAALEAELLREESGENASGTRIVKTKAFRMKPMAPEEAVLQMELLGHDFFFFTNAETERAAVVYRRDDGDVGLIDQV